MAVTTITGDLQIVNPLAAEYRFAKYATIAADDRTALKAITDLWPIPAHVLNGTGTIGSRRAELSDDDLELCIRDWWYRNANWTGSNQVTAPVLGSTVLALTIYNWMLTNAGLNSGKGPTMTCATVSAGYVGSLAVYGIPARSVHGRTPAANVDVTAEYWSPAKPGWVHVLPHVNGQITLYNKPASLFEWAMAERQLLTLNPALSTVADFETARAASGVFGSLYYGGSDGTNLKSAVDAHDWAGYGQFNSWDRGNTINVDPAVTSWGYIYVEPRRTDQDGLIFAARHLNDIEPTPNALHLDVEERKAADGTTTLIVAYFEWHSVDVTGNIVQFKPPGGAWTTVPEPARHYAWAPTGSAWQFRVLGPAGNHSNVVTVTA